MYHIRKSSKPTGRGRWVLLEHLPPILSPRILLLVFLYAMAFTLLLLGLKMLHLEHKISSAGLHITSILSDDSSQDVLLYQQESSQQIQKEIASQIIRLHVIANSDSDSDQALKLRVRDAIITKLQQELEGASTVEEARSIILTQMPQIEQTAQRVITQQGYAYTANLSLENRYFPVKIYGDLSFPAGEYEALCLEIGEAAGHNWWCVLFPSLCFVDETYAVVPEESKKRLQDALSQEEYDSLQTTPKESDPSSEPSDPNRNTVEFHSALYDWIMGR